MSIENNNVVSVNYTLHTIEANGEKVFVDHIFEFPSTDSQFVTIRSFDRFNLDRFGKPEPIVSTVRLTNKTFQEE